MKFEVTLVVLPIPVLFLASDQGLFIYNTWCLDLQEHTIKITITTASHQQSWYWVHAMRIFWSSLGINFNNLWHFSDQCIGINWNTSKIFMLSNKIQHHMGQLIGYSEVLMKFLRSDCQANFSDWWLMHLLWNYECHWTVQMIIPHWFR